MKLQTLQILQILYRVQEHCRWCVGAKIQAFTFSSQDHGRFSIVLVLRWCVWCEGGVCMCMCKCICMCMSVVCCACVLKWLCVCVECVCGVRAESVCGMCVLCVECCGVLLRVSRHLLCWCWCWRTICGALCAWCVSVCRFKTPPCMPAKRAHGCHRCVGCCVVMTCQKTRTTSVRTEKYPTGEFFSNTV